MKMWQKVNLFLFLGVITTCILFVYFLGSINITNPFGKPWHMQPSVHEDSLSQLYKDQYQLLDKVPLRHVYFDSSRTNVFIMLNAWGVPTQEAILKDDLKPLESLPHQFALHRRLSNNTQHAERVEFKNKYENSVLITTSDSTLYKRSEYIHSLGFSCIVSLDRNDTDSAIQKIDSLLTQSPSFIAWTAEISPTGNHGKIQQAMQKIANLAKKHPDIRFVIQGTHRPVLCGAETRNSYKSHWVPVAVLNIHSKE